MSTFTHAEDSDVYAEESLCREAGMRREMSPGVDGRSSCGYGDGHQRQSIDLVDGCRRQHIDLVGVMEDASEVRYA